MAITVLDGPVALALVSSALFGVALVLTQFGLKYLAPRQGALISIPTITVLLWALAPILLDTARWNLPAVLIFSTVGLVYPAAVTLLTYEANRQMGPSIAGALGNLGPVFAVAIAAIVFGDLPGPLQALGIAAIVAGVVAVSLARSANGPSWPLWAIALPLGAAAIRGAIQPITKIGLALWPNAYVASLSGFTASSLVIAAMATMPAGGRAAGSRCRGAAWFSCVGLCNGGAVLTLYAALARGSVTLVAPLVATYPLVTVILTRVFLGGTRIEMRTSIGIALTVSGVALLLGS